MTANQTTWVMVGALAIVSALVQAWLILAVTSGVLLGHLLWPEAKTDPPVTLPHEESMTATMIANELLDLLKSAEIIPQNATAVRISGSAWEPVLLTYEYPGGKWTLQDQQAFAACCRADHPMVKFLDQAGLLPPLATRFEIVAQVDEATLVSFEAYADTRIATEGFVKAIKDLNLAPVEEMADTVPDMVVGGEG